MIKHQPIKSNFIYPRQESMIPAYKFGSDEVVGVVINPEGDWRSSTPPEELQERNGVESSSCYIQALQHAIATIQEKQFGIIDSDYSERYNALLSNGSPVGGDPIEGMRSIRTDGMIKDSLLPFSPDITSWEDFHSFKGANEKECRLKGELWRKDWEPEYDIVFQKNDPIEEKYSKLREALKFSPVPMSVAAWYSKDGIYMKPYGARDNHLTLCVYVDENNRPYFWDTYSPFLKIGEPNYNSEFAMRLSMKKIVSAITKQSCWQRLLGKLHLWP